jgi:hypothetical protein
MAKAKPNNNDSTATIQMPPVKSADAKRSQTLISAEEVASVFNDDCVSRLAKLSRLPANANKSRFAQGIRDAVLIYLRDVAVPDGNDIHREISKLHQAAQNKRYEKSFEIATHLSEQALAILNRRNLPGVALLTDPSALLDPARQRQATEQLAALCRNWVPFKPKEGRKRPGGRRSKTFAPDLYAPPASSHFEKRGAERTFLMWLRIAWLPERAQPASVQRQRPT